jgi:hypothetical protein
MKKTYEKPLIIVSEEIQSRAVSCSKPDHWNCPGGPITS